MNQTGDKELVKELIYEVIDDETTYQQQNDIKRDPEYITTAQNSIGLYFVSNEEEVNEALEDKYLESSVDYPQHVHQLFPMESDEIYGYKDLYVNVLFSVYSHQMYIEYRFSSKLDGADDIIQCLSKFLPKHQPLIEKDAFIRQLEIEKKTFKPKGEMIKEIMIDGNEYEIYYGDKELLFEYYTQVFPVIQMYIERANVVNVEGNWEFFNLFHKIQDPYDISKYEYRIAAQCNVYRFYHYPDSWRYRIGQFITFPNYQRKKLGRELLSTIYDFTKKVKNYDLTVEDACEDFQKLRIFVELTMLEKENLSLQCVTGNETMEMDKPNVFNLDNEFITKCPDEYANVCRERLAITKMEMDILFVIMVYNNVRKNPEYLKKFALEYKRKIYSSTKTEMDMLPSDEKRLEIIERYYKQKINSYTKVLNLFEKL